MSTTVSTIVATEAFPLEADPQIDDHGRSWVDLKPTRPGADAVAEQIIRRLRGNHRALARVHAAAINTGPAVHPEAVRALSDVLMGLTAEVTLQTCEDLGRALIDAAEMANDPAYIEAATATHDELVGA